MKICQWYISAWSVSVPKCPLATRVLWQLHRTALVLDTYYY